MQLTINEDTMMAIQETPFPPEQPLHLTHINQLITEIQPLSGRSGYQSYVGMFLSLFQLSRHLFKRQQNLQTEQDSFEDYLSSVQGFKSTRRHLEEEIRQRQPSTPGESQLKTQQKSHIKKSKTRARDEASELQLIQCYEKVPYVYFEQDFVLNFGLFNRENYQRSGNVAIQTLNDNLDLVEINLFAQIHRKFHQYFKVVANLDYLRQSISTNILKVKQVRKILQRNREGYVQNTQKLRKHVIQRQNIEKLLKSMKTIKHLNKLPAVVDSVLQSSLPYQCLSLIQSTKKSLKLVSNLKCLTKIQDMLRNCQGTIHRGLNKSYTDSLYNYLLGECQSINFNERWSQIKFTVAQNHNNSSDALESYENNSIILDEDYTDESTNSRAFNLKRQEGRQYEIAMILLESYQYIEFAIEQGRAKITNFIRLFFQIYESQLTKHFRKMIEKTKSESILQNTQSQGSQQQKINQPPIEIQTNEEVQLQKSGMLEKMSIEYYIQHVKILNEVFGEVLNRYLGFVLTLLQEYQNCANRLSNEQRQTSRKKFQKLFEQEFAFLPILYKLVTQRVKSLIVLKNLNGVGYREFYKWLSVPEFWIRRLDDTIEEHPLLSYNGQFSSLVDTVFKRTLTISKQLKSTLVELTINYVKIHHQNMLYNELKPVLQEESWQSVQIPKQFEELVSNIIFGKNQQNLSNSISILNDSHFKPEKNQFQQQNVMESTLKIKVLKNNLLFEGERYKVSVSLLFICEIIDEYIKIGRLLDVPADTIFVKLFELIDYYNKMTTQLILGAKALTFERLKTKNITARHMCLLSNCLSVLAMIVERIPGFRSAEQLVYGIKQHRSELHRKLSTLLYNKVQSTIQAQLQMHEATTALHTIRSKASQTNNTLLTTFLQMFQIVDDYLDRDSCQSVFKESIQFFMQKYFTYLKETNLDKNQMKIFIQKLKFLKSHFSGEFTAMEYQGSD